MTQAMASKSALSVVGRIGIHWSASATAVLVHIGSITMMRAPASFACFRYQDVLVPYVVSAGFQPAMMISLACTQSVRLLPVRIVP